MNKRNSPCFATHTVSPCNAQPVLWGCKLIYMPNGDLNVDIYFNLISLLHIQLGRLLCQSHINLYLVNIQSATSLETHEYSCAQRFAASPPRLCRASSPHYGDGYTAAMFVDVQRSSNVSRISCALRGTPNLQHGAQDRVAHQREVPERQGGENGRGR